MDERLDERRLQQLLRDAAGEAPEPSFTMDDVTTASRRATARRRSLVAIAAAVVMGAGTVTGVVLTGSEQQDGRSTALAPNERPLSGEVAEKNPEGGQPGDGGERGFGVESFPDVSPKQGGGTDGEDGTPGCQVIDRELATALAGELPVDPIGEAIPYDSCFVEGNRAAAYRVPGGTVAVVFDQGPDGSFGVPHEFGNAAASVRVDGGLIAVIGIADTADHADVPLRDELPELAERVAAALDR
ncbi:hypothetical protein [Saccharomonospora cyanea]|uniref:Uncharacterized protein n=1 Tax=Saccharomonospora cyanea NA-134 TaxID=882082 RepID=H5XP93_9PSEU|nr:hypothetical protein [Saccharomonospora cyanea]EHR63806.1 hypothetical protein SaccyDRAFT_5011 [Saccharomonospora cyanea NA-134]